MDTSSIIESIESGKKYKQKLKSKETELNKIIKNINKHSKMIKVNEVKSKYKNFPARKKYSQFTGIDLNFFKNIL